MKAIKRSVVARNLAYEEKEIDKARRIFITIDISHHRFFQTQKIQH